MLALKKHSDGQKIQRSFKLVMSQLAISFVFWGLLNAALWTPTTMSASDEEGAYLNKIEQLIIARWKLPPKSDGLKVILRYWLARSGAVSFVRVDTTSGNQSFDDSAVQAVRRASPFPPPPKSFPIGDVRMVIYLTGPTPSKPVQKKLPDLEI